MKAILAGAEQHRGSSDRHRGELEPEKFPTRHSARSDFVPIGRFLGGVDSLGDDVGVVRRGGEHVGDGHPNERSFGSLREDEAGEQESDYPEEECGQTTKADHERNHLRAHYGRTVYEDGAPCGAGRPEKRLESVFDRDLHLPRVAGEPSTVPDNGQRIHDSEIAVAITIASGFVVVHRVG